MTNSHNTPSIAPTAASTNGNSAAIQVQTAGQLGGRTRKPATMIEPKDGFREIAEMVVFVVVLVLLLKSFVAEAFVIPTGSMATTLWGYQKVVTCPQCGYEFPVNCSDEFEKKPSIHTIGATCPNCRYDIDFAKEGMTPASNSGDRVLVAKCFYDTGLLEPKALDVVVFKPPADLQVNYEPRNYIKRLVGLPGETIGIWYGDLYRLAPEKGPKYDDSSVSPLNRWQIEHVHRNQANQLLMGPDSPFEIIRKLPDQIIAMRRIVHDNDHQPQDRKRPDQLRWAAENAGGWTNADANGFKSSDTSNSFSWLRYRNLLRSGPHPELITDFMGYNTKHTGPVGDRVDGQSEQNWVGDLMLECELEVDQPTGVFVMELSKGVDRFQARWVLNSGECRLVRISGTQEVELAKQTTSVSKKGNYKLAFSNVDARLTVWVDGKLPFGDGESYLAPRERGPTENDLQPASIASQGAAVTAKKLKLWRDTYYTVSEKTTADLRVKSDNDDELYRLLQTVRGGHELFSEPRYWQWFRNLPCTTIYVQPDHYLCLGDNSQSSRDGRDFGLVPKRLLQGRAMLVYWPFRLGIWPLNSPENRFGPIH